MCRTGEASGLPALGEADVISPFEIFLREVATSQLLRIQGLYSSARQLLVETTRLLVPGARGHSLTVHPAVVEVRHILDSDLSADVTLTDLASRVHLSPTYLTQLFTTQLGQSSARYRQCRRLRGAQVLLAETDLAITETLRRCCSPDLCCPSLL